MQNFRPQNKFFVGIDSDGCVFDSMELKHKECFIPNIIQHYGLQGVSKYAREVAEFVNLYSTLRGINRFPGLVKTLRLLKARPEVQARGVAISDLNTLDSWCNTETRLGNPALEAKIATDNHPELIQALTWSKAVNASIAEMVENLPPFPLVKESFDALAEKCDMLVVSGTPNAALEAEWSEHDIRKYVAEICGQESGSKQQTLRNADNYAPNHSLMLGDSPGDQRAAESSGSLFFPINPGDEETSWKNFLNEGISRFFDGTFAGQYQANLIAEFRTRLPEQPPW